MNISRVFRILALTGIASSLLAQESSSPYGALREEKVTGVMHSISSHSLFEYVRALSSEEYEGRLTGTPSYNRAAQWTADLFKRWNVKPLGDRGSYFQEFP